MFFKAIILYVKSRSLVLPNDIEIIEVEI